MTNRNQWPRFAALSGTEFFAMIYRTDSNTVVLSVVADPAFILRARVMLAWPSCVISKAPHHFSINLSSLINASSFVSMPWDTLQHAYECVFEVDFLVFRLQASSREKRASKCTPGPGSASPSPRTSPAPTSLECIRNSPSVGRSPEQTQSSNELSRQGGVETAQAARNVFTRACSVLWK